VGARSRSSSTAPSSPATETPKLQRWPCPGGTTPRALILFAHGRGEYGARYARTADVLGPRGIACAAFDFRGFGRSPGPRCALERFDDYLDDLDSAVGGARATSPDLPLFVCGHSMGGLVALRWVQARAPDGLAGLILSSPFLAMCDPLSPIARAVVGLLSALRPGHRFAGSGRRLTRDDDVHRAYQEDPLVVQDSTARWVSETLRAQRVARAQAAAVTCPLLTLQGGADSSTDPAATRAFHDATGSPADALHVYDGLLHEVLNELPEARARVLDDLSDWVLGQV